MNGSGKRDNHHRELHVFKADRQSVLLASIVFAVVGAGVYLAFFHGAARRHEANGSVKSTLDTPFDGRRSYRYLKNICAIGRRVSGSPGMQKQQEILEKHFTGLGGKVSMQRFEVRHPEDGSRVPLANMIVQWHPESTERVLICAHYDTRPFPDRDRSNPRGVFIGANDGGSGVAVLSELAHHIPTLNPRLGVDFVLFDGEELVFDDRRDKDYYFLGSTRFAQAYKNDPPRYRYKWGVLLDMVGDAELRIYREYNSFSLKRPKTRQLVYDIWNSAKRIGVREFVARTKHEVRDDHLPLNDIAKIPTCDIIDFDYPRPGSRSYWHTTQDTPDKCSGESLQKVGAVIIEWLTTVK